MRRFCLALYACLLAIGGTAHGDASSTPGLSLYEDIAAEVVARGVVVKVDEIKYMRWVIPQNTPRLYNAAVFFTAPDNVCEHCRTLEKQFDIVAKEFYKAGSMNLSEDPNAPQPLFFFVVNAMKHNKIPYIHDLTTAPTIALVDLRRTTKVKAEPGMPPKYLIPMADVYTTSAGSKGSAGDMLRWMNNRTHRNVEMNKSFLDKLGITGLLVILLCAASACIWKVSGLLRRHPSIMGFGALGLQWVSTAGLFWSLQHSMHLFGFDRNTMRPIYILPNRRNQFLGEGLVMSFCSVAFGSSLLVIIRLTKSPKPRGVLSLLTIILVLFASFLYSMIWKAYTMKTGHGGLGWTPPTPFSSGPLMKDRGNSF